MNNKTNKVEFGLNNVHYSVITYDELNNKSVYSKPKKLIGAVSLTMDVEGETTTVYANNAVYYTAASNQGYSSSLNITTSSRDFLKEVFSLGEDNGVLYEEASAKIKEIALGFEIDGDNSNTRVWMYRVSLNRASQEHNSKTETIEADTYEFKAMPRLDDQKIHIFVNKIENENEQAFDNWFEQVYEVKSNLTKFEIINLSISNGKTFPKTIVPEFTFSNMIDSTSFNKNSMLLISDKGLQNNNMEVDLQKEDNKIIINYKFTAGNKYSITFTELLKDINTQSIKSTTYNFQIETDDSN